MPLPPSDPQRQLKHHRAISVQAYARDDGLWEVDARITDVKSRDIACADGVRPAGAPVHDLLLRLVVDTHFNILQSGAQSEATPYPGHCDQHGDAYGRLAGMNLMQGFKRAVREALGGVAGCTHLTELADVLPTAVIQAFAGEVIDTRGDGDQKPFQLDRCHALASHGEVVRLHYPRWFRQPGANKLSQNRTPVTLAAQSSEPPTAEPRSSLSS
jgi:hypothetical protein